MFQCVYMYIFIYFYSVIDKEKLGNLKKILYGDEKNGKSALCGIIKGN